MVDDENMLKTAKKRVFLAVVAGILLSFICPSQAFSQWNPSEKTLNKADNTLRQFFNESIKKSAIDLNVNYYEISQSDSVVGYACIQQAPSKHDQFDFLAIYSPCMKLQKLRVLTYRENYGGEIANKRWLKQFLSRKTDDIQAISGATISVESMKMAVVSLTEKMKNWQKSQL